VPATPTTSISSTDVVIDWTAPDDHGESITEYDILIEQSDGSTYSASSSCDGTDSTIRTNTECTIPMSEFTSSPYSLAQGTTIEVKIAAYNANGWSSYSSLSTGAATAETVPVAPGSAPTEDSTSDETQIVIDWT
jgi:hypothetical protein